MAEHLRALVFILAVAIGVFAFAKRPLTAAACTPADFDRRRNLWFTLTLAAFLAHNFWLFAGIATLSIYWASRVEPNRFALYLGTMLALPRFEASIPGFGVVNDLFAIEPLRLLSFFVLLPAFLSLRAQPGVIPFGRLLADKLLLAALVLDVILVLPYRTFTAVLRENVLYAFTDTFLLYYVASRSLRSVEDYRDALGAFMAGALVFCAIVFLEFLRGWLLYAAVDNALGIDSTYKMYLKRSGRLRAEGTAGQAIACGYVCAVAIGLFCYVRTLIPTLWAKTVCVAILTAGVIGAFSRAPWLGAILMIVVFMLLGPSPVRSIAKLAGISLLAVPLLVGTEAGQTIIDHLPWIGTVDARSVDGRDYLIDVALMVIMQNPWFGRFDFFEVPAIQDLRGSDGIIDIVNTYVYIALRGGVVSLALFIGFVLAVLWGLFAALRRIPDRNEERHALGRALMAAIVGVLFIIATMSAISFVYPVLWCLCGMSVGFFRLATSPAVPTRPAAQVQSSTESAAGGRRYGYAGRAGARPSGRGAGR